MKIQFGRTHPPDSHFVCTIIIFVSLLCPGFFHEQQSFLLCALLVWTLYCHGCFVHQYRCVSVQFKLLLSYSLPCQKEMSVRGDENGNIHWIKTLKPSVVVFCFFHQTCGVVLLRCFCSIFQGSCKISAYLLWPADGTVIRNRCAEFKLTCTPVSRTSALVLS